MKPETITGAKAWLAEDPGRLDRWNALRDRACVLSLTVNEAAEWIVAMDDKVFQQLKERVG